MRLIFSIFFSVQFYMALAQISGQHQILLRDNTLTYPPNFSPTRSLQDQLNGFPQIKGRTYCWIQFYAPLGREDHKHLSDLDIRLEAFVKHHTYLASIPPGLSGNPLSELKIRGFYKIEASHRLSSSLRAALRNPKFLHQKTAVLATYLPDLDHKFLDSLFSAHRLVPIKWQEHGQQLQFVLPLKEIQHLAELPVFRYIEHLPPASEPEDRNGRAIHRSELLHLAGPSAGIAYDGSGVNVLVRDDGQVGPHIDYLGRLNQDFSYRGQEDGTHGDMVSGIVMGANNLMPTVQGMASGAFLFTEDYDADFLGPTLDLVQNHDVVITNTSYSDGCNDGNTIRMERVDAQIYDHPQLMHVFSAGNNGGQDCGYGAGPFWGNITGGHKAGKNSIATANLFADYSLVFSSSRGPVFDGRIKPDISAHGQDQLSTYPNHTILPGGGTSAAAPGIAGVMAQLYQVYKEMHNGQNPESALIKGCLLTTANDMGNPGPDFIYGWGHVNAFAAYKLLEEERYQRIIIGPGQKDSISIAVPDNITEARFMIYWADPAAIPQATEALINDIELRVYPPGSSNPLFPMVLDHSPDPALLNLPAKPGEDHINNMEQVRILNPNSGSYTISMEGLQIPFGDVPVYLLYEFRPNLPQLVFPTGGEHFDPNGIIRVYWEALLDDGPWDLEFTVDSGYTWVPAGTMLEPSLRHFDLQLPDTITQNGYIRLHRNGLTISNVIPFQLLSRPKNISVSKACPDSISITWDKVPEATGYDVYVPGEKYMEINGTTDTNVIVLPTWNPLADNWVAVRSRIDNQIYSERTIAFRHNLGLIACKQDYDVKPDKVISPSPLDLIDCESGTLDILISIKNDGLQPVTNVPMYYQVGTEAPVMGFLSGLFNPGAVRFFKFPNPPQFTESGKIKLKIWTDWPDDNFRFNDTLYLTVNVNLQNKGILTPDFIEDFETSLDVPEKWTVINENTDDRFWIVLRTPFEGTDSTNTLVMLNYYYDQIGARDIFLSPEVNLTNAWKPRLAFDIAYSGLAGFGPDSLLVLISTDCGKTIDQTIYAKTNMDLITVPDPDFIFEPFVPGGPSDWRTDEIDLSAYAGQRIQIQFVHIAGYGNNLWLDNIRVIEDSVNPLAGGFTVQSDSICLNKPMTITDASLGSPSSWEWHLGEDAQPPTSVDSGPIEVLWTTPGWKTIQQVIHLGPYSDTVVQMVFVSPLPTALFSWSIMNDSLLITNSSLEADSWNWYVNGTLISSEKEPHIGIKNIGQDTLFIQLFATNGCGSDTSEVSIALTAINEAFSNVAPWYVSPNPAGDKTFIHDVMQSSILYVELIDMQGRISRQLQVKNPVPFQPISLDLNSLPSGNYLLRLWQDEKYKVIILQKG